jgi:L-iduronidase
VLAHYRIDEDHGDPYRMWEAAGAPDRPSDNLLAEMRANQELALLEEPREVDLSAGRLEINFELPLHAVSLLLLQEKPAGPPAAVSGLRSETYPGLNGQSEHLLHWHPLASRAVRTYEVLRSSTPEGPFERINPVDLFCSAYLHAGSGGCYKVRALDFWGRAGEESEIIQGGTGG